PVGPAARQQRRRPRIRGDACRRGDAVHQRGSDAGPRGDPRSEAAAGDRAGARAQAASAAAAVLRERPHGVPALRTLRRSAVAGAVPYGPQRHRHRRARGRRDPAQVRAPDAHRRCGGRFSGAADRDGASVVSVARRGDLDLPAQADGLHRPFGMVPEVFRTDAGSVRELAAEAKGAVRIRLPVDHTGSLACRLREDWNQGRGPAADPEGECRAVVRIAGEAFRLKAEATGGLSSTSSWLPPKLFDVSWLPLLGGRKLTYDYARPDKSPRVSRVVGRSGPAGWRFTVRRT